MLFPTEYFHHKLCKCIHCKHALHTYVTHVCFVCFGFSEMLAIFYLQVAYKNKTYSVCIDDSQHCSNNSKVYGHVQEH